MVRKTYIALLSVLLCGCDKVDFTGFIMPTGDVVDCRFEQSLEMHGSRPVAGIDAGETYTFYVAADTHISDDTANLDTFVTALRNDGDASFGVMLGDCIDRRGCMSLYLNAIAYDAHEHQYPTPIFSAIGNHDIYFSGWEDFRKLIGPSVYWFEVGAGVGKDLFIILDSAGGTLGGKQTNWLNGFLAKERMNYRHCFIITHTNLLYTDNTQTGSGNMPMDETLKLLELFGRHNVSLCLQGHDHHREDTMLKGVRYTIVGSLRSEFEKPEYLCIRVSADGMEYDWRYITK